MQQMIFAVLGDPRTNQNPALLSISILFFRWHNVVAARVQKQHPDWSDEDVFQRTRRIVVANIQVGSRFTLNREANNRYLKSPKATHF